MTYLTRYRAPHQQHWQGRAYLPPHSCFFQSMQMLNLAHPIPVATTPTFGLLGFCCDEGIRRNLGRPGAMHGPNAIREALAKMSLPPTALSYFDAGDIICEDGNLEATQQALADGVALLLQANITPIIVGGGHELAFGHYLGIAKYFASLNTVPQPFGIVNFDAHFDMRPLLPENKGSSGTPFLQIANAITQQQQTFYYHCIGIQPAGNMRSLFDTAAAFQTRIFSAEELHQASSQQALQFVADIEKAHAAIYLSLCLDVFAAPYAPGVSAPQALGATPWQIIPLIRHLAASGKIISYDIAELSPAYDVDHRTAKLAAHFIYEIIHHHQGGAHATFTSRS